jgi:four helix bundle protein
MDKTELIDRIKKLCIRIISMVEHLPKTTPSEVISDQVLRSVTSMGANYRAAWRSKSPRDFINKLKIVEEETDETLYWLELIELSGIFKSIQVEPLKKETTELLSIIVASIKTAKINAWKKRNGAEE